MEGGGKLREGSNKQRGLNIVRCCCGDTLFFFPYPVVLFSPRRRPISQHDTAYIVCSLHVLPRSLRYAQGWTEKVSGKMMSKAVYQSMKKDGILTPVFGWFDFGSSFDVGRQVKLEWNKGKLKPHPKIELVTFSIADDELLPCPVSTKNCRYSGKYHGVWNVTDHRAIPTVYTMPHGYRADPRLFGYVNPADPASPFKPKKMAHDIEFEVYDRTGNVLGMKLRYQTNWQVKPTDVYYPNLWQPTANSTLVANSGEDGMFMPVSWSDITFRVSNKTFDAIAAIIQDIMASVVVYQFVLPVFSILVIGYASVTLYIRGQIEKDRARIIEETRATDAVRASVMQTGAANMYPAAAAASSGEVVIGDPADAKIIADAMTLEEEDHAATIRAKFWDTSDTDRHFFSQDDGNHRGTSTVVVNVAPAS